MKKTPQTRWINTKTVWQWVDGEYVKTESKGYWYTGPVALAGGGAANTGIDAARFYASDNTTTVAAQDADPVSLDVDTTYVWRVRIYNSGTKDESSGTYTLNYDNTTKATGWQPVNASSSHIQSANATGLTNGTAVTSGTLTGAAGTFLNGEEIEDGVGPSVVITQAYYTEYWYAFTIVSTDVDNADNINLRVERGTIALDFDNVNQSITVVEAVPNIADISADTAAATASGDATYIHAGTDVAADTAATTASGDADYVHAGTTVSADTAATTASAEVKIVVQRSVGEVTQFTPMLIGRRYGAFAPKGAGGAILTADIAATTAATTASGDADYIHSGTNASAAVAATTASADADYLHSATTASAATGAVTASAAADYVHSATTVSATTGATTAAAQADAKRIASVDANAAAITASADADYIHTATTVDATAAATTASLDATAVRIASVDANTAATTAFVTNLGSKRATVDANTGATTAAAQATAIRIASVDADISAVTADASAIGPAVVEAGKTPAGGITGAERYEYRKSLNAKTLESKVACTVRVGASASAKVISAAKPIVYRPFEREFKAPELVFTPIRQPKKVVNRLDALSKAVTPSVMAKANAKVIGVKYAQEPIVISVPGNLDEVTGIVVSGNINDDDLERIIRSIFR